MNGTTRTNAVVREKKSIGEVADGMPGAGWKRGVDKAEERTHKECTKNKAQEKGGDGCWG